MGLWRRFLQRWEDWDDSLPWDQDGIDWPETLWSWTTGGRHGELFEDEPVAGMASITIHSRWARSQAFQTHLCSSMSGWFSYDAMWPMPTGIRIDVYDYTMPSEMCARRLKWLMGVTPPPLDMYSEWVPYPQQAEQWAEYVQTLADAWDREARKHVRVLAKPEGVSDERIIQDYLDYHRPF